MSMASQLLIHFPIGLLSSNAAEWVIHKYVLHGWGKRRSSFWSFHWYEHHHNARRFQMSDPAYQSHSLLRWNSRTKEAVALLLPAVLMILLFPRHPGFAAGGMVSIVAYYVCHRRSHAHPDWGRRRLPWHVDHHLGPNQDANWCVTFPLFDWILGTREPYVGTERERADLERRDRRERVERDVRPGHGVRIVTSPIQ